MFHPEEVRRDDKALELKMRKCPLKEAWQSADVTEQELSLLLHCASTMDIGTMDEAGFGSCTNTGACSAECPKEIGQINIARLNQEYISSTLAGFLKKKE